MSAVSSSSRLKVPSYAASHGCARIPMWAADWLYRQSPVGETVYVYR